MKQLSLFFFLALATISCHAQLIINELSQGPAGNQEYVELLVTGTPTCGGSNTVDIRGWILDDNNSWHASGSQSGIAGGHVRFDSIAQWASVKIGSLILVYNDADTSPAVHALTVDTNDANHDCVYVVPVSSSVLQKNTTLPSTNGTMTTYGVAGTVYSPTGTWSCLVMANGGDAFHTVSPANYSAPYHAIGWGQNGSNQNINTLVNVYYSGSQSGKTIYMANTVSNDPFNAANFIDTAATLETPGTPNNAANAAWIASLNNQCQPFVAPTVSFNNPTPLSCNNASTVIIASSTTSGASFNWSNGVVGSNDTVTSGGTYRVTVSDAGQLCTTVDSITIASSTSLSVSISSSPTTCGLSNGSATITVTSGTATNYHWSNNGNTATISGLPSGTYLVTVTGNGGCSATATVNVGTSAGNAVSISSDKTLFCSGDSAHICAPAGHGSYLWSTGSTDSCIYVKNAGNYYVTVTDNGNCTAESNHVAINVHPLPPVSISVNGDTLNAYGSVTYQWYFNNGEISGATSGTYIAHQSGSYTVLVTDSNGCTALSNPTNLTINGINNLIGQSQLNIYPNPFTGNTWTLETSADLEKGMLEVFDSEGRLVLKSEISSRKSEFLFDFAKGIYLLKLTSGENAYTRKLIHL